MKKRWMLILSIVLVIAVAGSLYAVYQSASRPIDPDAFAEKKPESAAPDASTKPADADKSETSNGSDAAQTVPAQPADPAITSGPDAGSAQTGENAPQTAGNGTDASGAPESKTANLVTQEPAGTPLASVQPTAPSATAASPTPVPTLSAAPIPTPIPTPEPTPVPTPEPTPEPLPLAGLKIGIDPGHQLHADSEKEPVSPGSKERKPKVAAGTSGRFTGVPEHVVNLQISLGLRDALIAQGAQVKMTRETDDVNVSNIERAQMMNEWGADVVLRLHCNGASNSSANGIGLYVKKTGDGAEDSLAYAKAILPYMAEATGAAEDGVFRRDTYSGLNWSEVPSILVEMGFMTNKKEDINLNDPAYQQKLIDGMVRGVAACFDRTLTAQQADGGPAPADPADPDAGE